MITEQLLIRKGVRPDIQVLSRLDHAIKTSRVWQMQYGEENGEVTTKFVETQLPREMRIQYPHSPEILEEKWGDFALILVGCIDNAPIGYLTVHACFPVGLLRINDMVVGEIWRRKGFASKLIETAIGWAKERGFYRLSIEMSSKNYPAISFAKKLGFEYSGFNDNYFSNRDIAIFFTRDLRIRSRG